MWIEQRMKSVIKYIYRITEWNENNSQNEQRERENVHVIYGDASQKQQTRLDCAVCDILFGINGFLAVVWPIFVMMWHLVLVTFSRYLLN